MQEAEQAGSPNATFTIVRAGPFFDSAADEALPPIPMTTTTTLAATTTALITTTTLIIKQ